MHNINTYKRLITTLFLLNFSAYLSAQNLEPRAYTNAPIGLNFLLAGYQYSSGGLIFDESIPVSDAETTINIGFIGGVHTLNIAGNSSKIGLLLPYSTFTGSAILHQDGEALPRERDTKGIADPSIFLSTNFYGAPATSVENFKSYQQDLVIGSTLTITAPLGVYDSDKLINISTNRWTIKPGIGASQALGNWTFEGSFDVSLYTENNNFSGGKKRQQAPVYSTQLHTTYNFPKHIWVAVSATYYTGGRTTVDGIEGDDLQENWRTGITLSVPINRYNSVKLYGSSGVSTRTGNNYDAVGFLWQYRWAT